MLGTLGNIVLDYLFIFRWEWVCWGSLGNRLCTAHRHYHSEFLFPKPTCQIRVRPCRLRWQMFQPIFLLGGAEWITEVASGIVIFCFNFVILKKVGNTGVAAYGIIANIALVAACLCTGIAQGVQPLLSRSYGKSDLPEMKKLLRMTICTALGFAAVLYGVLFALPSRLFGCLTARGMPPCRR